MSPGSLNHCGNIKNKTQNEDGTFLPGDRIQTSEKVTDR